MDLSPIKKLIKKTHFKKPHKTKDQKAIQKPRGPQTADVVEVSGDANPFRNGAKTLSRAAWNRLRVFVQLVDGFPAKDERRDIVIGVLRDLLVAVRPYFITWSKLAPEHKQLMVEFVSYVLLSFFLSYYLHIYRHGRQSGKFVVSGRGLPFLLPSCITSRTSRTRPGKSVRHTLGGWLERILRKLMYLFLVI